MLRFIEKHFQQNLSDDYTFLSILSNFLCILLKLNIIEIVLPKNKKTIIFILLTFFVSNNFCKFIFNSFLR